MNEADGAPKFSFDVKLAALTAMTAGEKEFAADGVDYTLDADGNILAGGEELGYVSRLVVSAADSSVVVTRDFKNRLEEAIDDNAAKFNYTDAEGNEAEYDIVYDRLHQGVERQADDRDLRLRPLRQPPARRTGWAPTRTAWTC